MHRLGFCSRNKKSTLAQLGGCGVLFFCHCVTTKRHASWWMEVCTSFGRLGADCSRSEAPLKFLSAVSQPLEIPPNRNQLGTTSANPQSPSRQSFRRAIEEVHRLEAALSALGEGNPLVKPSVEGPSNCPFQGQSSSFGRANRCVQAFSSNEQGKRVSRVEAVISRALEEKVVFEKEVQEGEAQQLEQRTLLDRILLMSDSQSAWLILLHCASVTYLLRVVEHQAVVEYARTHDDNISGCLHLLLYVNFGQRKDIRSSANLPLVLGGVGLKSSSRISASAYWPSWADCLPMVSARHRGVALARVVQLEGHPDTPFWGQWQLARGHWSAQWVCSLRRSAIQGTGTR